MYDQYTDSEEEEQSKSLSASSTGKASSVKSNKQLQSIKHAEKTFFKSTENKGKRIEN